MDNLHIAPLELQLFRSWLPLRLPRLPLSMLLPRARDYRVSLHSTTAAAAATAKRAMASSGGGIYRGRKSGARESQRGGHVHGARRRPRRRHQRRARGKYTPNPNPETPYLPPVANPCLCASFNPNWSVSPSHFHPSRVALDSFFSFPLFFWT